MPAHFEGGLVSSSHQLIYYQHKVLVRQILKTGFEVNDGYEAVMLKTQSCNQSEVIFVSETRSTHVAHAGLELAIVAEDDLELVTFLSLLPKFSDN